MTVIEVDGTNVQPLQVDSIQIFAGKSLRGYSSHFAFTYRRKGQRYSFVVSWPSQYGIQSNRVTHMTI
jgi:Multicopper oxidase